MIDPASQPSGQPDSDNPVMPTEGGSITPIPQAGLAPVARQQRISSLDILRGVAVLGILLMNIVGFGLPHWAYDDPTIAGGSSGPNLITWIITSVCFEGTMRAMFSLLFGAGVILLTSRLEARAASASSTPGALTPADIYFRRNMWLIAFGLFHSYVMLWLGDILFTYGLVGMFLYVFRRLQPSRLIVMSIVILLAITARSAFERNGKLTLMAEAREAETLRDTGAELTSEQNQAIDNWNEDRQEYKPPEDEIRDEIEDMHRDYLSLVTMLAPINFWLQTTELCKLGFWDASCMMLLGMALMKLGVLSGSRTSRTYLMMLAAGYALGLTVNIWETSHILRNDFRIEAFSQADVSYDIGRLAMVIGHIGAIMLVWKSGAVKGLMNALAACGQMALTNYLMQTVICSAIFFGHGLGLHGSFDRWQLYLVVAGIWILQLIVSPIWLSAFQFGPVEWLWRSLTYWKRQPMIRTSHAPAMV